ELYVALDVHRAAGRRVLRNFRRHDRRPVARRRPCVGTSAEPKNCRRLRRRGVDQRTRSSDHALDTVVAARCADPDHHPDRAVHALTPLSRALASVARQRTTRPTVTWRERQESSSAPAGGLGFATRAASCCSPALEEWPTATAAWTCSSGQSRRCVFAT